MDQLKTFLRQCVKYRFWIAVGVSLLLPLVGYFVGSGAYTDATKKREGEIKSADTDVGKYTSANQPNPDYKKVVDEKKEVLAKDVDSTQRKLYERQEPLLKWPDVVQDKFRTWGREWPKNTDRGVVQAAIYDYTVAYPEFVSRVYQTVKPWNPEDGTGIVFVPDEATLLKPAPFKLEAPPELGKVWAEQERLWVVTALLDVVAKVNQEAGAKDWDGAWIKQILDIDVGSAAAQDQKSLAKGVLLDPAPPLVPEGTPVPDPAAAPPGAMGGGMMPGKGGGGGGANDEVYYLKSDVPLPYKVLPIEMTVLVEQSRLAEFLVGLENSPMAIQVMEPEIAKPSIAVVKPVYGESNFGMEMGYGGRGNEMMRGMAGARMQGGRSGGSNGMPSSRMEDAMAGMMGGGGFGRGNNTPKRGGTDLRGGPNKSEERLKKAKEATQAKATPKKNIDQYLNVIQVTVYGQARFYNTPAPIPPAEPSTSTATATEPTTTPTNPAATPATTLAPTETTATAPVPVATPTTEAGSSSAPPSGADAPKTDPATPKVAPSAPKS